MPSENDMDPIGNPEPVTASEKTSQLGRVGAVVTVIVGGTIAFACMVTPTRLSGASRSVKLKWQERRAEIERAVASQAPNKSDSIGATLREQQSAAQQR
jgi:hypothetical protein